MSFLNPIGLLGLIGIPILILIYILKSKYQEYSVSSTFLWELSEKFLTKKSPLSKFSGLLNLILQILTVLFLSLALSNPVITLPNHAKNYVLIVDDSASMNISSRFNDNKEEMIKLVDDAKDGSKFTIILAGNEASVVIENQDDKEKVKQSINSLKVSNLSSSTSNGLTIAQSYFDSDKSLNIYLFSDIIYESYNNIEIINAFKESDYNASINSLYQVSNTDKLVFKGEVISYAKDNELTLNLLLDNKVVKAFNVNCNKDEETVFEVETELVSFNEAKVIITNEDSLKTDNEYIYYGSSSMDEYKVLLVSNNPIYLESMLKVMGNNKITVTNTLTNTSGYDLYVYDSLTPTTLPEDGAVWLFNAKTNITNAGFAIQDSLTVEGGVTLKEESKNARDSVYKTLTQNLTGNNIIVKSFNVYNIISKYTTIMSYNNYPMIFAGTNNSGNRQVVFSFDLHDSNFPLLLDYIILMNNMVKYSLPSLCDQTTFLCGDELKLNVLPTLQQVRINTPSNYSTYLQLSESVATYKLNEIGTYVIEAMINGVKKEYKLFVSFPIDEQNTIKKIESIDIIGEKENISYDSKMEIQWILFIIALLLCIIEWEVYVYEQRYAR